MTYEYGLLKPIREDGAEARNAPVLARDCYGIEVTEPELAARCALGNLDPQHLGMRSDLSAIEAALDAPLPARKVTLVTIRPDADAYGAMAVLSLRAERTVLTSEARHRIASIGKADKFDLGQWPGSRPLPQTVDDIDEVGPSPDGIGALHIGLALPSTSIDEGVRSTMHWILTGEAPTAWLGLASQAATVLFSALSSGAVTVRKAIRGQIAVVEGVAPGSLRVGYRLAPIVIAVDFRQNNQVRLPHRKMTIAQFDSSWVDLREVARVLSADEPGWGGSSTIVGSPQGIGSRLPINKLVVALLNR